MKPQTDFDVRHLRDGDVLTDELLDKWGLLRLDHDWVWVVEQEGGIDAVLIAAPMHGMAMLLRVAARECAPPTWLLTMLRVAMAEMKERGLIAVMTYLSATRPQEQRLLRMANKEGWCGQLEVGFWMLGSVELKH